MLHSRIFSFNPLETNCTVLWADGSAACTVVDPGMSSPENYQQITDFLQQSGLTPDAIFLTHGHFDHVWGVRHLLDQYPGIPAYLHPLDKDIMRQITGGRALDSFTFLKHEFPTVDVADGDTLTSAGTAWKVLHTPGHSPGSVCYWSQDNNLLMSGDTLFAGSIGRTDLVGGDYDTLMDSLLHKVLVLPDDTDVIPGHGQPTTIGREALTNPFLEPFNDPDPDL